MLTSKDQSANKDRRILAGDPWAGLAAAIILQAARDAQAGSGEAAAWLLEEAPDLFGLLGLDIHPDRVRRWVLAGCPGKRKARYVRS